MKKAIKLLCFTLIFTLFGGCSSQGLSNKSIVKAILVDVEDNNFKVSIVLLNCEPSSQIAEIKETAKVYTSNSDSLEKALINAEKQQNKSAFYAQNELLLINSKAVEKFDQIVRYFNSENCARPGMTVYLTQATEADLKTTELFLPKIVNDTQNINVLNSEFNETRIYDVTQKYDSISAAFPVLEIDDKDGSCNIKSIALIVNNELKAQLKDSDMAIAITLLKLSTTLELSINDIYFKANNIVLSKEMKNEVLNIYITGSIKSMQSDREDEINHLVTQKCTELYNNYFESNNILNYDWWYEMNNISGYKKINFISQLKII